MPAAQPANKQQSQQRKAPRRHVTTACLACRESKIKCDGGQPSCEKCKAKGRECKYSQDEDKRRVSLRNAIEILSARVDQLSQHILNNGLQLPPMEPEAAASLSRILDVLRLPAANSSAIKAATFVAPNPPTDHGPTGLDFAPAGFDWNFLDGQSWGAHFNAAANVNQGFNTGVDPSSVPRPSVTDSAHPTSQAFTTPSASQPFASPPTQAYTSPPTAQPLTSPPTTQAYTSPSQTQPVPTIEQHPGLTDSSADDADDDSDDELIKQISTRMGSLQLAPDGHLRYYGATSNILCDFPDTDHHQTRRSVRKEGRDVLEANNLDKAVDPAIEEHLINLYFAWQDPFFHVVDEKMYRVGREEWRVQKRDVGYYSEVLTNAMCAAGAAFDARYHPNFVTWPKSLADYFADRAKALLELEMDSPCLATVQALVILGGHEMACKRDARGWLYSGMAMRLAFDLGLHLDMTDYVRKGKISAVEADIRRTTFWGTYIVDHLSGFYYGRPVRINNGDIAVTKPTAEQANAIMSAWVPYGSHSPMASDPTLCYQVPLELVTKASVELCETMEPLGHVLYGVSNISRQELHLLSYRVTGEMLDWKANLPPLLQVNYHDTQTAYLPHVLMLHMLYHQMMIYIHRPYVSKTYIQPMPPQGPGHMHAQQMCIESSTAIVDLLRLYEQRYTFRRMNIHAVSVIFTTSLILIFIICSKQRGSTPPLPVTGSSESKARAKSLANTPAENAIAQLSVCFRALEDLTQSYDSARRTREFLVALQQRWQQQAQRWNRSHSAGGGSKRQMKDRPQPATQHETKRPRGSTYGSSSLTGTAGPGGDAANQQSSNAGQQQQHNLPGGMGPGAVGAGGNDFDIDWSGFGAAARDGHNSPDSLGEDILAQLCSIGPAGVAFP
ncbi:Nitrogen assimilation transcription factor nirA [Lasiodiplodia hormozganensis]|uniref:Nitrogen assimilation transcription factor nirA n=1 Tax=Lasiodiplodia hormozganensis TaxID=869390 RepID=A0AA40CND4_9PEZI|nr:Nitrogen assimilation transcription factor nirA [Lasiodiplodia hormozganensis]